MVKTSKNHKIQVRRPWYKPSLTTQILLGLVLGGVLGYISPEWGNRVYFLRDIFLNLIKSIIAPLIFSTLVVGIAGGGDLKKVGRMGLKALLYFEIVTTIALFIGLGIVNLTKPGYGVALTAVRDISQLQQTHAQGFREMLVHIFPSSVLDAMVRGDVLQIVAFAALFAVAVSALGQRAAPDTSWMRSAIAGHVQIYRLRDDVCPDWRGRGDGPH